MLISSGVSVCCAPIFVCVSCCGRCVLFWSSAVMHALQAGAPKQAATTTKKKKKWFMNGNEWMKASAAAGWARCFGPSTHFVWMVFLVGSTIIGVDLRNYRCCCDTDHRPISCRSLALMWHQPLACGSGIPTTKSKWSGQVIISAANISNDFGCVRMSSCGRQALDRAKPWHFKWTSSMTQTWVVRHQRR